MTEGSHDGHDTEFYGILKEIIEMQYNSNLQFRRSVVLFRCDWFDMAGKKRGIRNDGYFKSINIEGLWYKTDPFILATQSKKVFYLQDTLFGKNWQVVQTFAHRNMYNVAENDKIVHMTHQDEHYSDSEHEVQAGNDNEPVHHRWDGQACSIDGNLNDLVRNHGDDMLQDSESATDEDDTLQQYYSD